MLDCTFDPHAPCACLVLSIADLLHLRQYGYNLDALHPEWLQIRRSKVVIAPVLTCNLKCLSSEGVPEALRTAM